MRSMDPYRVLILLAIVYIMIAVMINPYDYNIFKNWVQVYREAGLSSIYAAWPSYGDEYRIVYPPLSPVVFISSYKAAVYLSSLAGYGGKVHIAVERIVVKSPIIAALIIHAVLLMRVYRDYRYPLALLAGPPVILVVAAYDFEPIMMLLAFSAILMHSRGRHFSSGVLLGLSTLFKPVTAVLLPYITVTAYKDRGAGAAIRFIMSYTLVIAIICAPFIYHSGLDSLLNSVALYHASRHVQGPTPLLLAVDAVTPRLASMLPLVVVLAATLIVYRLLKPASLEGHLAAASIMMIVVLLSGKVVNPVYMYWVYALAAPVMVSRGYFAKFFIVSGLALLAVGLWYSLPLTVSAVLDKPYYDEETGKFMDPEEVDRIINDTFIAVDISDSTLTMSPGVRDLVVGVAEHNVHMRYLLITLYTAAIIIMLGLIARAWSDDDTL